MRVHGSAGGRYVHGAADGRVGVDADGGDLRAEGTEGVDCPARGAVGDPDARGAEGRGDRHDHAHAARVVDAHRVVVDAEALPDDKAGRRKDVSLRGDRADAARVRVELGDGRARARINHRHPPRLVSDKDPLCRGDRNGDGGGGEGRLAGERGGARAPRYRRDQPGGAQTVAVEAVEGADKDARRHGARARQREERRARAVRPAVARRRQPHALREPAAVVQRHPVGGEGEDAALVAEERQHGPRTGAKVCKHVLARAVKVHNTALRAQ